MIGRNPEVATQPLFFGKNRLWNIMKKIKLLLKNHWKLLLLEIIFILIYTLSSFFVGKCQKDDYIILSIIFSAEFFVTILVAVGAIYSWFVSKAEHDYDKNLSMLKDIEKIREFYKDKSEEQDIVKYCQKHLEELKREKKYSKTFLYTYLNYVEDKNSPLENEEEQFEKSKDKIKDIKALSIEEVNDRCVDTKSDDSSQLSLGEIKAQISKQYNIEIDKIKYSKNYEEVAKDNDFKWTTWYSLRKSFITSLEDGAKIIFFTNVRGKYEGVIFLGKNLKDLSTKMKDRNKKNGDTQYDFYITQLQDGTYWENRNELSLVDCNIERLDFEIKN